MTSLVDALEERGLARRAPDTANRRVIRIEVTGEGSRALKELRQARRTAAEDLLAPLSREQREELSGLLTLLDVEHSQPG